MEFKQIQELIKVVNKSNIAELHIEEKDFKIIIRQKQEHPPNAPSFQMPQNLQPVYSQQPANSTQSFQGTETAQPVPAKEDNLITIKSPMIGTFYRRSSPDKPLFVEIGDEVTPGKVVCIIEAMKLFNEIESEITGKIVKVLVEDANPVEFDQPLFLVEQS